MWLCRKLYREAVDVAEESDNTNCEVFVEPDGQVTQASAPEGPIGLHTTHAADRSQARNLSTEFQPLPCSGHINISSSG